MVYLVIQRNGFQSHWTLSSKSSLNLNLCENIKMMGLLITVEIVFMSCNFSVLRFYSLIFFIYNVLVLTSQVNSILFTMLCTVIYFWYNTLNIVQISSSITHSSACAWSVRLHKFASKSFLTARAILSVRKYCCHLLNFHEILGSFKLKRTKQTGLTMVLKKSVVFQFLCSLYSVLF